MATVPVVPLVVAGERVDSSDDELQRMVAASGLEYRLPSLSDAHRARLLGADHSGIAELQTQEVIAFLNRVGRFWKNREYTRRRLFERQLTAFLGYSPEMAKIEADRIGALLTTHWRFYDLLEVELGSRFILDEWIRREECYVRAFPRGRVAQLLSGNVPFAVVVSLIRALITKNAVIAKVASDDPITATSLVLSFLDVDADHPISRATSVVYWHRSDLFGAEVVRSADAVSAWGGSDAIEYADEHKAPGAPLLAFGAKRSVALVGECADIDAAAESLAHDVCEYNQRACFSPQYVFCAGDPSELVEALARQLARYQRVLPLGSLVFDEQADATLVLATQRFLGRTTVSDEEGRWRIVIVPKGEIPRNPLARTVIVVPVESLTECLDFVSSEVQTVSVHPWEAGLELRDDLARAGVSRIVEIGLNNLFRTGGSHDDVQPLMSMVRIVSNECASHVHGKGMVVGLDQTSLIENGRLMDVVL